MFEKLIAQIEAHASYGPAMKKAAQEGATLVLDYHTHGPGQPYCLAIRAQPRLALPVFGQTLPAEELVHVKGIGKTEEQCLPLMQPLAEELLAHFGLKNTPEIHRHGRPLPDPEDAG